MQWRRRRPLPAAVLARADVKKKSATWRLRVAEVSGEVAVGL